MTAPGLRDVSRCYRLLLDREVEDASAAAYQLAGIADLWGLIERVAASPEAIRRGIARACRGIPAIHDPEAVSLALDTEARGAMLAETVAQWDRRGLGVQYDWLVRDQPRYAHRSLRWNVERMFDQGEVEAEALLRRLLPHGIALEGRTFASLGQEAARMATALAPRAAAFVGIEVHGAALEVGCAAVAARGLEHVSLVRLEAFLAGQERYDLFHSAMTLQHAAPPVAHDLLDACLDRLRPGGHALVQLACQLYDYRFDAAAYAAGRGRNPEGEIHALPQHHVLALFSRHGMSVIEVLPDGGAGPLGVAYTFLARKRID